MQLASHFFRKLFDFGLLSEAGADAYRRILIALIAVILSVGLLATRMYLSKYVALSQRYYDWGSGYQSNRGPYQVAILGDGALALAFPMLIVAFVVVLVSTSLFPDDLDYRVLRPLGVPKRLIFVSKALAASLFTGIFAVAAYAAMTPLVLLMWNSRWADQALLTRLGAHGAASLSASVVTALVITATAGVLLVCVPRSRLRIAMIVFRSVGLFCVVLVIPLASRLATLGSHIAAESKWMYLVPPVWFVGVEQLASGHATPFFLRLAGIAAAVAAVSAAVLAGSYILSIELRDGGVGTITRRHVDATRTISAQASTGHHRCGSVYPHNAREELTPSGCACLSRRLRGGPGVERLSAAVGHEKSLAPERPPGGHGDVGAVRARLRDERRWTCRAGHSD